MRAYPLYTLLLAVALYYMPATASAQQDESATVIAPPAMEETASADSAEEEVVSEPRDIPKPPPLPPIFGSKPEAAPPVEENNAKSEALKKAPPAPPLPNKPGKTEKADEAAQAETAQPAAEENSKKQRRRHKQKAAAEDAESDAVVEEETTAEAEEDKPAAKPAPKVKKPEGLKFFMDATVDAPLQPGQLSRVSIRLRSQTGKAVGAGLLKIVREQRLHAVLIDHSMRDFQVKNPWPAGQEGEFTFAVMPLMNGPYRLFVEATPYSGGEPQVMVMDLPGAGDATALPSHQLCRNEAKGYGLQYRFGFDGLVRVGRTNTARLLVTDENGKPFSDLEPVLGHFAQVFAVNEDGLTFSRLEPGDGMTAYGEMRGGPQLQFRFEPKKPGFTRFFVQLRINGHDMYVPFGVMAY